MKYRKASHVTFDCRYHIVWITKYRNPALSKEIQKDLDILLRKLCKGMYVNVLRL